MNQPARPENRLVTIVGGGLAGLATAFLLARDGIRVKVIEKKRYPFHKVCGEYISNETLPFLKAHDLFPSHLQPTQITTFQLTSVTGREARLPLDTGGFGVSRFAFDNFLYQQAVKAGAEFMTGTEVTDIRFTGDGFQIETPAKILDAAVVIGAHGKRAKLDHRLNRSFVQRRSPWVGVKYHARTSHPSSLISLHNFVGGYCGVSNVEGDVTNICYLVHRDKLRLHGSIDGVEKHELFRNVWLEKTFGNAQMLFEKPEVINEISFETKTPVEHHVLMAGDAAGMIAPLCGNGMAMAIRSATIASRWTGQFVKGHIDRRQLEDGYAHEWRGAFATRLRVGRQVQKLFGSALPSNIAVWIAQNVKPLANALIKSTHGQPFES